MLNKDVYPIQENLFEYDFQACYYNILKYIGYDVSKLSFDDKKTRNIQIGMLLKNNPSLKNVVITNTKHILELYIKENKLEKNNIIWRQKDGFITNKKLEINNITFELTFRNIVSRLISTMNRDKVLIIYSNNNIDIKGVRSKPIDLSFFDLFLNIDFSNKKKILEGCDIIRTRILESNNVKWFTRVSDDGKLTIPMKGNMLIHANKSMLLSIDTKDIDKKIIYEMYVYPFFQTLLICNNK